jgi:hypothetical protein
VAQAFLPAQAPQAPSLQYSFTLDRPSEVGLSIRASAPGSSWRDSVPVLRIDVDGRYNQHVPLFMGDAHHDYRILLGPLEKGTHRVVAADADAAVNATFTHTVFTGAELEVIRRAPVLYWRADMIGRHTDAPLLSYYEWLPAPADAPKGAARLLQFTWIFSNEDGGTDTVALMARWGRTTDIEYLNRVYFDAGGKFIAENYQGKDHAELPFGGKRIGAHAVLGITAKNNIFGEVPESEVRTSLWPLRADLSAHSREQVMDDHPWTYRVAAQELEREGKLIDIADPRRSLYLEARVATLAAGVSFAAQLKDGRVFRSDRGQPRLRIERSGWVRTTIELPRDARFEDVSAIVANCDPPAREPRQPVEQPFCGVEAISKFFLLDDDYRPGPPGSVRTGLPVKLKRGESARF